MSTETPDTPSNDTPQGSTTETSEAAPEAAATLEESVAEPPNKAGKEAAKYRTQLREVEAAAQVVATQLETQRAAAVTATVAAGIETTDPGLNHHLGAVFHIGNGKAVLDSPIPLVMHDPADLTRFTGTTPADYLDDAGAVDADKVRAAMGTLYESHPYLFNVRGRGKGAIGPHVPNEGKTPSRLPGSGDPLAAAIAPR